MEHGLALRTQSVCGSQPGASPRLANGIGEAQFFAASGSGSRRKLLIEHCPGRGQPAPDPEKAGFRRGLQLIEMLAAGGD
jgi:hypothetical protein